MLPEAFPRRLVGLVTFTFLIASWLGTWRQSGRNLLGAFLSSGRPLGVFGVQWRRRVCSKRQLGGLGGPSP